MTWSLLVLGGLWLAFLVWSAEASPDIDGDVTMPPLIGTGALTMAAVGYANGKPEQITIARISNGQYLRADAADAYNAMMAECPGGANPTSGYRSNEQQKTLHDLYLSGKGNLAALPGYSNHQMGLSVDENNINPSKRLAYNADKDAWLLANCGRFGWTRDGLSFGEPWHMTYTGVVT